MHPSLPDLEDHAAMAVFADALAAQGDPRGELTHLQLALEEHPLDQRLLQAEARHRALHAKALLGPLATASSMLRLEWKRGLVVRATLRSLSTDPGWGVTVTERPRNRFPRLIRELDALPVMARLERLGVSMVPSSFSLQYLGEAFEAAVALRLPSLRRVRVALADWAEADRGLPTDDDGDELPAAQPLVKQRARGRTYELAAALEARARATFARLQ